jgi:hypothetical protein
MIICDDLRRGNMLNSGNNDREQNWLLLSPRVKRVESDWPGDCNPWMSKMRGQRLSRNKFWPDLILGLATRGPKPKTQKVL